MRARTFLRRRDALALIATALWTPAALAAGAETDDLAARFAYLSQHGNSSCSLAFQNSIAKMPPTARLQGSCCSPMVLDRYVQQVRGLRKYASFLLIPPDPYDIDAGRAQTMMAAYGMTLRGAQQAAYDFAKHHAAEKGPCCCKCWRWQAYGGLAKLLIRDHGFTGLQIAEVWNLSDGCGGSA